MSSEESHAPDASFSSSLFSGWQWPALATAWVFGAYLRIWEMGSQVVMGDETHTLISAVDHGPWAIMADHGMPDVCIPLALWTDLLLNTIGVGEWGFRLPVLAAGILFVPLFSLFVWRYFGALEGVVAGWLTAALPLLLLYSRFTRPYMPIAFLSLLALVSWLRWVPTGRLRYGMLATGSAVTAVYFSVTCAPAILTLAGCGLIQAWSSDRARGRSLRDRPRAPATSARRRVFDPRNLLRLSQGEDGSRLVQSLGLFAAGGVVLMLLFLPGLVAFSELVSERAAPGIPGNISWGDFGRIVFGTDQPLMLAWLVASTAVGTIVCWRRQRVVALIVSLMLVGQMLGVFAAVQWLARELVLARFSIAALPGFLMFTAVGVATQAHWIARLLPDRLPAAGSVPPALVGLALGGWIYTGPIPEIYNAPNAFTNRTQYYVYDTVGSALHATAANPDWPEFYEFLENSTDDLVVLEGPLTNAWVLSPYAIYQDRHRQVVRVFSNAEHFRSKGVRFGSVIPFRGGRLDLSGVDFLIVHRDVVGETSGWQPELLDARALNEKNASEKQIAVYGRKGPQSWPAAIYQNEGRLALLGIARDERLQRVYEDEWIVVFATDRRRTS